jgi:hypothetical protein
MPVAFLQHLPAAAAVWERMHARNADQTLPPTAPALSIDAAVPPALSLGSAAPAPDGVLAMRAIRRRAAVSAAAAGALPALVERRRQRALSPSLAHGGLLGVGGADDEADAASLFCGLPDCVARIAVGNVATTRRAATAAPPPTTGLTAAIDAIQPAQWEHAVVCACCGYVWPVPVPHPSAYFSASVDSYSGAAQTSATGADACAVRACFVCADYPPAWRRAVLATAAPAATAPRGRDSGAAKSPALQPLCPSLAQFASRPSLPALPVGRTDTQEMLPPVGRASLAARQPRGAKTAAAAAAAPAGDSPAGTCAVREELAICSALAAGFACVFAPPPDAGSATPSPPPALARLSSLRFLDASAAPPPRRVLRDVSKRWRDLAATTRARLDSLQAQPRPQTTPPLGPADCVDASAAEARRRLLDLSHAMRCTSIVAARSGFVGVWDARLADGNASAAPAAASGPAVAGGAKAKRGSKAASIGGLEVRVISPSESPSKRAVSQELEYIQWRQCSSCKRWRVLGVDAKTSVAGKWRCEHLGDGTTCKTPDEGKHTDRHQQTLKHRRMEILRKATAGAAPSSCRATKR